MKKRILFLMSDTGGGHRAAAGAIAEAIHYLYPRQYDTIIEDIWKGHTPWPINQIPNSYGWLTGPGRPLWKLMWISSTRFQAHKAALNSVSPLLEQKMTCYLSRLKPDLMVSVHPLMNHLGLKWLDKIKLDIPFVTVVTDMINIHPLWICPEVTLCLVSTEAARSFAVELGMSPQKVKVCGQPVGLKFISPAGDKRMIRRTLGLAPDCRTVMVMGGGEGVGRVFEVARAVAQTVPQAQLLIVAGRNKSLRERLERVAWEIPTAIYGFVDNMHELMRAADLLITKAGPGTISEAFVAGLPALIFGYTPGQEQGNVTYVQEHRAGAYAETPQEIANLVRRWLKPDDLTLRLMADNAAKLARPKASLMIASQVCNLIE